MFPAYPQWGLTSQQKEENGAQQKSVLLRSGQFFNDEVKSAKPSSNFR